MRRSAALIALAVVLLFASRAFADRIDDLMRALEQDPSYKVRVQAALVLGKLADKRAVSSLLRALLRDDNETVRGVAATSLGRIGDRGSADGLQAALADKSEFVRTQAKKALELVANPTFHSPLPNAKAGAKFFVSIGFQTGKLGPDYLSAFRRSLIERLNKIGPVTLAIENLDGDPNASQLGQKHLAGLLVDGNISNLSAKEAGGQMQIDCDVKGYVATYPGKAIRTMVTESGSIQTGMSAGAELESKRDCLGAIAEALGDDVEKYLKTVE